MINCKEAVGRLWAYLDRNLGRVQEQELEEHLGLCRHCCGELAFVKQIRDLLKRPGSAAEISPDTRVPEIRRMGFAFRDAFVHTIRPLLFEAGIPVVPALPHSAEDRYLVEARDLPGQWMEAAVVPVAGYGRPAEDSDFIELRRVGEVRGRISSCRRSAGSLQTIWPVISRLNQ